MPFHIVAAMVFATWFGSEAVLGIPSTFIEEGFHGIVEDPFGSFTCLMLVGLFFARPLYRMNLLTMGDFFRQRYGSTVEVITSLAIMMSYLGWIAAQLTALGVVFNVLSDGSITTTQGMLIGAGIVLVYTLFGGMWSVALTDFFQDGDHRWWPAVSGVAIQRHGRWCRQGDCQGCGGGQVHLHYQYRTA